MSKTDAVPGSQMSDAPENESSAASLMHWKFRRERKEDDVKVGESQVGWITGELRLCALLRGVSPFKGCYFRYFKGVLA